MTFARVALAIVVIALVLDGGGGWVYHTAPSMDEREGALILWAWSAPFWLGAAICGIMAYIKG